MPNTSPAEIIPRLYLSDLADAENRTVLGDLCITHVLSMMPGFVDIPSHTSHTGKPTPIHRVQIPIEDNPFAELAAHLPSSTAFIREALRDPEARVLVHCVQGISRSASVVCAFLMALYGWSPGKAVAFVKAKRWIAEPNFGFVAQLHEYEKTLQPRSGHAR
jgi:atypical dual specificity phosphatase